MGEEGELNSYVWLDLGTGLEECEMGVEGRVVSAQPQETV